MVDFEKLKSKMKNSGMTITSIARQSNTSRETLYNRLKGVGEFTASEIDSLTKTLRLTRKERDEIFFNSKSELNSQNEKGRTHERIN